MEWHKLNLVQNEVSNDKIIVLERNKTENQHAAKQVRMKKKNNEFQLSIFNAIGFLFAYVCACVKLKRCFIFSYEFYKWGSISSVLCMPYRRFGIFKML